MRILQNTTLYNKLQAHPAWDELFTSEGFLKDDRIPAIPTPYTIELVHGAALIHGARCIIIS